MAVVELGAVIHCCPVRRRDPVLCGGSSAPNSQHRLQDDAREDPPTTRPHIEHHPLLLDL